MKAIAILMPGNRVVGWPTKPVSLPVWSDQIAPPWFNINLWFMTPQE